MGLGAMEVQEFVKALNRAAEDISLHRHNCNKLIEERFLSNYIGGFNNFVNRHEMKNIFFKYEI